MSTLEKAINLLYKMPEPSVEIIYAFMEFLQAQNNGAEKSRQKLIDETADKLIADNMEAFLALAK